MKLIILVAALAFLPACQFGYIVKSGYYQLRMLAKRESLDRALADPHIDEKSKRKISIVKQVKQFAENELFLKQTTNYDTFVLLDDKYVVYALTASLKNKLEPYLWSFPIVGKVPYKGFFKESDAQAEKAHLENLNLDVSKRGVSAFSTLGWFSDPLLSSMLNYNEYDLVETVIHELTHATLYIKSNAGFNERLATFVGFKGMEAYYIKMEGPNSINVKKALEQSHDSKIFAKFITGEIKLLEDFYNSQKTPEDALKGRNAQFDKIKTNFAIKCKPNLKTNNYDGFPGLAINNATLLGYKTYYQDLSLFEVAFQHFKGDWKSFIAYFLTLDKSQNPEADLQSLVGKSPNI